ncbi:MAG: hypothetical protein AB201_03025 [Parcubacteria bacterium C7867-006]|nr:MAG: hypothetical protein AB201_03025 [Parcubacteria bacterium C7867-006]
MNYLLKSKPKNEHKGKFLLVSIVLGGVLILGIFFLDFSRNLFYSLARPLWISENFITAPFRGITNFFVFKNNLINQKLELEDEIASLKLKQIDYDVLLKENQELKDQIGRSGEKNLIFSRVLSRPPRSPYDTFVIDVGSNQGVFQADRVYMSDNIIVGVVKTVTPNTSLVELFSSGDNKQEAILSRTGASFVLVGKGGANFQIEVPRDADILWGDMFLYPGINSSVIGSVYYIDSSSQSSFKTVYIRSPGNVFQAKSVFVNRTIR